MTQSSLASFAAELVKLLPYIIRGISQRQADALLSGKITVPQYLCLDLLATQAALKMKDIAKSAHVSLPAATGLVERLYSIGLVKRESDEKDRRVIYVTLTAKGKKVIDEVRQKRKKAIEDLFGKLSEVERNQYLKILRKLKKILYPKQ